MIRVKMYGVAVILLSALAVAVSSANAQSAGSAWVLEKAQGVTTIEGSPASLILDDKQLSGSTGCNTFTATIADRPGKRVAISDVALTRKLCAPEANNNERAIVMAFSKTEFVEQGPGTLTFLAGNREPLLVWKTKDKVSPPEGSVRAVMPPPRADAKTQTASKQATKAKSTRKDYRARSSKVSRKNAAHWRTKHSQMALASRHCRCLCGRW